MEITVDIKYEQVLKLARQLPYKYKRKLNREIGYDLKIKEVEKVSSGNMGLEKKGKGLNDLQEFLLKGPSMTDEQFEDFKKLRRDFSKWLDQ